MSAKRTFTPWAAYAGGGYKAERYAGRSWLDWANWGCGQMAVAVAALTKAGKTEAAALAQVASIDEDKLAYWQS